jgi:hypothetical protein
MQSCNRSEEKRGVDTFLLRQSPAKTLALALLVMIFILMSGRDGTAQVLYGSIVGTVTDSSGSVVPDAAVKAKNIETNETAQREPIRAVSTHFRLSQPAPIPSKFRSRGSKFSPRTALPSR